MIEHMHMSAINSLFINVVSSKAARQLQSSSILLNKLVNLFKGKVKFTKAVDWIDHDILIPKVTTYHRVFLLFDFSILNFSDRRVSCYIRSFSKPQSGLISVNISIINHIVNIIYTICRLCADDLKIYKEMNNYNLCHLI